MEVYTKILGNYHSSEWHERLDGATIDYIDLDQWSAQKSRLLAVGTSGRTYPMALNRGSRLADGDIIAYNSQQHSASIVRLRLGDVMIVDLTSLHHRSTTEAIAMAVEIGHALGNQHWAAIVRGESLLVPLTVDRKVMLGVMRTYNFEGIKFAFRPGREVIPYLTPSEIRSLFGSTAPESRHPGKPQHHHPIIEEYV